LAILSEATLHKGKCTDRATKNCRIRFNLLEKFIGLLRWLTAKSVEIDSIQRQMKHIKMARPYLRLEI